MIGSILHSLLNLLYWAVIIECVLSWIPALTNNGFYAFLRSVTEPIEAPIRDVVYRYINLPVDITPILAIVLINLLHRVVWILF